MSKLMTIVAVALIGAGLWGSAALAHPELLSAEPAAGAAATASPKQIRITFTEAVIPQFSGAEVKDQAGKVMAMSLMCASPGAASPGHRSGPFSIAG